VFGVVTDQRTLHAWFDEKRASLHSRGSHRVGESVTRGMAETLLPEGGRPWVGGETSDEALLELDFVDWPDVARFALEYELQDRNMEHLWRGAHLIVPARLESTVDDLLDEVLATYSAAIETDRSTNWCPSCGSEYLAVVEKCPDCGIALVATPITHPLAGEVTIARFDLAGWDEETRLALAHQLTGGWPLFDKGMGEVAVAVGTASFHRQLPPVLVHAWDGNELLVRDADAELVGAWIQAVEATIVLALDPDVDKLAYDVDDMSDESLTRLLESLVAASIPHELSNDGELFVQEDSEEAIEALLDKIDFPDELPAHDDAALDDPDDGLVAQEAMSDLFDAADRLSHDTRNGDAVLELVEGVDRIEGLPVPFGFERADWDALIARAVALRASIEVDVPDADAVADQAKALRDLLHPLV
jgi:hypothetical protein